MRKIVPIFAVLLIICLGSCQNDNKPYVTLKPETSENTMPTKTHEEINSVADSIADYIISSTKAEETFPKNSDEAWSQALSSAMDTTTTPVDTVASAKRDDDYSTCIYCLADGDELPYGIEIAVTPYTDSDKVEFLFRGQGIYFNAVYNSDGSFDGSYDVYETVLNEPDRVIGEIDVTYFDDFGIENSSFTFRWRDEDNQSWSEPCTYVYTSNIVF